MEVFRDGASLQFGDPWMGVIHTAVIFEDGAVMGLTAHKPQMKVLVKGVDGKSIGSTFGVSDAKILQVSPLLIVEVGSGSTYFPIPPCSSKHLRSVVELCSGAGVFSSLSKHVGLDVACGVDMNPKWSSLFMALHNESRFVTGACGDPHVLGDLVHHGHLHPLILAGVACQPHSRAGDMLGVLDPRADSLPQVLRLAWMLQAPLVVLECVSEIQDNQQVQIMLRDFCCATGYKLTQRVLSLADSWCTRRIRWFACLASPLLGPLSIPDMPLVEEVRCIENVLPSPMMLMPDEMAQLQLSLYELSKFHEFAAGGIQHLMLNGKGQLPTCLHSAGNQLYPCKCGCHKGFSLKRLQAKGLFGTLVGIHTGEIHNGIYMEHCRYLHPDEMFALHGGQIPCDWGNDLRLALAAIGQSVAPLQAIWILSHVQVHISQFLQIQAIDPEQCFRDYVRATRLIFQERFPQVARPLPVAGDSHRNMEWVDYATGTPIKVKIACGVTVAQVMEAELQLEHFLKGGLIGVNVFEPGVATDRSGSVIDSDRCVVEVDGFAIGMPPAKVSSSECLPCPCDDWGISQVPVPTSPEVSKTLPFEIVEPSPEVVLPGLKGKGFVSEQCPPLKGPQALDELLATKIPLDCRKEVLARQGEVWADDELRFQLKQLCAQAPLEQQLVMCDPLVVTHAIRFGNFALLRPFLDSIPERASVVTCVLIEQHWYPLLWRFDTANAWAFTCGHVFGFSMAINKLHQFVCQTKSLSPSAVRYHRTSFPINSCCGALAIAYLEHLVWGSPMPESPTNLIDRHRIYREAFTNQPDLSLPRPWIWGLGEGSVLSPLQELLVQHGVVQEEAASRAKLVVEKVGETSVAKCLKSKSPWKELKWHASQCVPMLQIVKPSELQTAIEERAKQGHPVGTRQQKKAAGKGNGKGKTKTPATVDPRSLRIEQGLFVCGGNLPLSQLPMSQVGTTASGIVLCTAAEAEPFLKTGRPFSSGGLALIIVDQVVNPPPTPLLAESVRFPAWCIANSEPLLLDGLLYQVGAQQVSRSVSQDKFELISVSTCVVKLMLFRDQVLAPWETVASHPVKYILTLLPALQVCKGCESPEQCEHWHDSDDSKLRDPLMEVWGRQFLTLSYQTSSPDKADLFTVHMRLPIELQDRVLRSSGREGLYLEPKEVDGKRPSSSYQVFWMPRSSFQEMVHLKQITRGISGIARMGQKYGVRCRAEDAEVVHASVKPGGAYLPQGKKCNFIMGPMPFGTLKTSVMQIVEMLNWAARPMQPIAAASHVNGVMWRLQAVDPPPQSIVYTDHGEVLISRVDEPSQVVAARSCVVGASHTLSLVTSTGDRGIDVLQLHDPWEQAVGRGQILSNPQVCKASDPIEVLEKKVVEAVLAKLPASAMEVDGDNQDGVLAGKVAFLEQQVQELHSNQNKMHSMICEQGQSQSSQIASLQVQSQRLETAVSDQAGKLGNFQVQFKQQLERQQGQLDALFQQQMDRIEDLFQKKARTS